MVSQLSLLELAEICIFFVTILLVYSIQGVWSQNCHVMIKMNDVSTKVKSMDHLNRILRGRADVVTSS